jgi:poly-gamma-glutamate synthesis protein (capsule biosynthesis protein)
MTFQVGNGLQAELMVKQILVLLPFFICALSCGHPKPMLPFPYDAGNTVVDERPAIEPLTEKPPRYSLTLIAAGDNLFHEPIIKGNKQNGAYDFSPAYSEVNTIIENADLAFINQETVMAGDESGFSGYPAFNTPQSLAQTLADTGFDIINHANNHAMDMGGDGLLATLELWDAFPGITVVGARKDEAPQTIITANNITLGFLSYTYGLNGIPLPKSKPNLVSLINKEKMEKDIEALRPLCDFLIVSMHWGDEYRLVEPGQDQKNLAAFLAELNTDLIIGHHPHVLQRFETLPRPDGKETLCFYSLGNFVSNQRGKERLLGALMAVTFTKERLEARKEISISHSGLIPVICHYDRGFANTKVYPLYSYGEEMLEKHGNRAEDEEMTFAFFNSVLEQLGTEIFMNDPFSKPLFDGGR